MKSRNCWKAPPLIAFRPSSAIRNVDVLFPRTFSILNNQRSNSDSDPCTTNQRALSATVNLYFEQEATMKALQEGVTKYRRVPKIVHQENRLRLIGSIHI